MFRLLAAIALVVTPIGATAQTSVPTPTPTPTPTSPANGPANGPASGGMLGGLGGLLGGGALPNVASIGAGNAAGLLGYCVRNNVLGGANATSILGRLTGQQGVTSSGGYLAGQQGQMQAGGRNFSLAGLKDQAKTRLCGVVLQRARTFL